MRNRILTVAILSLVLAGCVSKKKYKKQVATYTELKSNYDDLMKNMDDCSQLAKRQGDTIANLNKELESLRQSSTILLNQLTDLSVISKQQAESIRKSIETMNAKDAYIKDLHGAMQRKDSLNLALVMNLKGALKDVNDEDVEVKVEGSAVFISLSDKMVFKSGSYIISSRAKEVLSKVADVLREQPEVQFMVEGHTDNKPISAGCIKDNWDLSVLRSTAIVRVLQSQFKIDPKRIIAAGRGEYLPLVDNKTAENRSLNRRTRIMIIPELDQFFKLLEPSK